MSSCSSRRLRAPIQRRDIGVKPRAHVLNVEDKRVDILEVFSRRRLVLAVKAINRQARLFISRVGNVRLIERAANSVLRGEKRNKLYVGSFV
jgi:hypothetical protein